MSHQSDEIILLTTFGTVLLVAGLAQRLQVSAAIGAFLVGIAVSEPLAEQSHRLLTPFRDLLAATLEPLSPPTYYCWRSWGRFAHGWSANRVPACLR